MVKQQLFKKKGRDVEVSETTQGSQEIPEVDDLRACIACRAHELFEQGGCCHGHDLDHWLQAEQEILGSKS
ncbi:MAG: hypothetical protein NPIRA02_01750 [Nitrospirales bacterium]|nr:MAG: hypothetical protein NPIRA02_01750 [Nitrospirales bacterium]